MGRTRDVSKILTSNTSILSLASASATYAPVAAGGLRLLSTTNITNGSTNAEITNVFSSSYENYYITYIIGQSADLEFRFRYIDSSGQLAGGNYFSQYTRSNTTTVSTARQTGITYGVLNNSPNTTMSGSINIFSPNNTNFETYAFHNGLDTNNTSGTSITTVRFNSGNAITGIVFFVGSGNYTGGIIRVYGYRN